MNTTIKKYYKTFLIIIFLTICCFLFYIYENKFRQNNKSHTTSEPIVLNLLTSVHPSLSWSFKPVKSKIIVNPGEVTSIEYMVENLSNKATSGIATFSYYPKQFGSFISKLNCFCYDAQTLKPKQKDIYIVLFF